MGTLIPELSGKQTIGTRSSDFVGDIAINIEVSGCHGRLDRPCSGGVCETLEGINVIVY